MDVPASEGLGPADVFQHPQVVLDVNEQRAQLSSAMKKTLPKKTLPEMKPAELRSIRLTLGKSQTEMADALGVGLRTMQHWELGERKIPGPAVLLARRLLEDHRKSS